MLNGYRENRIAQQAPYRTAIGTAAGESPRGQTYQHQRSEAIFCNRRRLGAVAVAAVPAAQNSLSPSVGTLPHGPGAASFGDAAGAGGIDRQHPVLFDGGHEPQGSSLGLGTRAARDVAIRRRQSPVLHAGKRFARAAGSRPPVGPRKRTSLVAERGRSPAAREPLDAPRQPRRQPPPRAPSRTAPTGPI